LRQGDIKTTVEVYKDNLIGVLAAILNGLAKRLPRDVGSICDNIDAIAEIIVNMLIEVTNNVLLILEVIHRRKEIRVIRHIFKADIITRDNFGIKLSVMLVRPKRLAATGNTYENIKVSHIYLLIIQSI
jgi:hypothetical protein